MDNQIAELKSQEIYEHIQQILTRKKYGSYKGCAIEHMYDYGRTIGVSLKTQCLSQFDFENLDEIGLKIESMHFMKKNRVNLWLIKPECNQERINEPIRVQIIKSNGAKA